MSLLSFHYLLLLFIIIYQKFENIDTQINDADITIHPPKEVENPTSGRRLQVYGLKTTGAHLNGMFATFKEDFGVS